MSEKYVEVNDATSPGAKIKTFESTDPDDNVVESQAVVVVNADSGEPIELATEASLADAAASVDSIDNKLSSLGQKAMAASTPVVIASDQSAVLVSGPLTDTELRASEVSIISNDTEASRSFTATNQTLQFAVEGHASIGAWFGDSNLFRGTISVQSSADGGLTWQSASFWNPFWTTGAINPSITIDDDSAGDPFHTFIVTPGPCTHVQLTAAPVISGSIDVALRANQQAPHRIYDGTWLGSTAPSVGQKTMASSLPVVLASDQPALAIGDGGGSITVDGPLTDVQLRATAVAISAAALPLPSGAATEAGLVAIDGDLGALLTALGDGSQHTVVDNFPVVQAVEDTSTGALANGTETVVAGAAVQVLAANAARKSAIVQNTGSANIRVGVSGVTATTGIQLAPGDLVELAPPYLHTGAVYAIREGGTSSVALAIEVT